MINQLFFVVKSNESSAAADCDRACADVCGVLGAVAKRSLDAFDAKRNLAYRLCLLDSQAREDRVRNLKARLLAGGFDFDVLMSDDFPCFPEENHEAGALVMDMDMTSVQIEGIDEIARRMGVYDEVSAVTAEAMRGSLDFAESLRRRVALLKGGDAKAILDDIRSSMPETQGLSELLSLCNALKKSGTFKTCIASGGFHDLISVIERKYALSCVRANSLEIDAAGRFTGNVAGDIVDAEAKADLVRSLKEQGIAKRNIIVIGDGANDLKMMAEGGLGIAYHAKPKVQESQINALNTGDLSSVAALLELRREAGDVHGKA